MKVSDLMDDENKKKKKKVTVADLMEASQNPSSSSFASGVRERYKASTEITPTVSKLLAVESMQSRGAEPTLTHRDLGSIQTDLTAAKRERSGLLTDTGFTPVDLGEFRAKLDSANQNVNRFESEKLIEDKVYQTQARAHTFGGQFSANKTLGRLTQNQSRAWGEYVKNPTRENRKIAESYDKAIEDFAKKNHIALDDENVKLGIISQSYANYIPQQVDQLKAQAKGAVVGGLAGLAVGAPRVGMKVGASISSGMDMYEITRGAAFKRLTDLGVDEETARAMATDEGILQGLIESGDTYLDWTLFGGKALATKLLPSLTAKASSAAGKTALAKVIKQLGGKVDNLPTAVKVAGAYGINVPQEGLEEGLQEGVSIANDQRVKTGETGFWNLVGHSLDIGKTLLSGDDIVVGRDENFMPIYASEQVKGAAKEGMKIAAVSGGMQAVAGYAAQRSLTPSTKSAKDVNVPTNPETKAPTPMSEASAPEVQQVQAQAEETKAQNPESTVLDSATTMYLNLAESKGKNTLKKAGIKADIVGRLIEGKKVEDGEINALNLTDAAYRNVFTQLTGVQFPKGSWSDPQVLRNLARSANKVAQQARQEQQVQVQQAQERAKTIQEQMDEAGYKVSPETQTRIDEETAKLASQVNNLDIGPDGKPLANLSTFAEAYRARVNPNATDKVIREQYAKFRDESRTILFGGHRLTKSQFTKLMRDHGKNLTDEQVNTLFNQAILDTLDGKDAFDRYTKKGGTDDKSSGGGISTKQKEAKTDGRTEQAHEGRSEMGDQRSQGKRRATQEGLRGAESAAGEHLRDGSLHRGDHQRTGESAGSVQEEGRRAEAGDGRGMETRNSSAGEVREREIETAHGLGARAVGERGQSARDSAESEALNISAGKAEVPTFKSWNEAFLYFEHGAGQATGFSFGDPPMLADEMTLGTGKPWKAVKTYPITKEGLAQFQSDIPNLLRGDVGSAVDSVPDFVGKKHVLTFAEKKKNAHKVTVDGHTYDAVSGADYTSAMHKIARQARKLGFRINFVYGEVHSSTGTCDGLTLPKTRQILVSVDRADYLKTARHEMFHARTAIDPDLHKTILDRIKELGLVEELDELYYAFSDKWKNYDDLLLDAWTYRFKIENEVFAEACAKATGHHVGVKAFFDIVQEEVDRWDAEHGASHAGDTKPLGNPSLDTLREWYGDQLGEFDLNDLTDEYDDFLESYHIPDKLPHSAVDVDVLNDYLDQLVESRGADFARDISSAIQDLELSRRVAEAMSNIEASVGAAQLGFDPYSRMQNEYGTYESGEKPSRTVDLPLQTKDDNKVGRTPRNVMEAEATPDTRIESIEQAVVDHKFSYKEGHNKIMVRRAEAAIRKNGWDESLTNWTRDVRDGKVNADLVAMGAVLLDNAGNSDMSGERYVQLVVDYHDLLHAAGQATQAGRILKNLTPGARLYGLRGYAKNMTERIRKGDPAHNIPVEKWMEVTGNLLADRLRTKLNVPKKHAKTVSQTILSDLNAFAKTAFPEQEKTPGRTEMDRINDLFDNYEKYKEAWDAAKETIKKEYADMPEALEVFNNFLETDLADTFIGQYFGHPEIRIDKALQDKFLAAKTDEERDAVTEEITKNIAQQIPATFMDKFTALRYLNMLGNFKTQIRNVTGNALNAGLTKGKNQVATLIELAVIKAGGKIERTKSFKKDPEVYRAALNDAEKMMDAILAGGKYEDGRRFDANIEKYRTIFKNKALEKYRKLTNEAMSRGDAVFSKIAYADALAGYLSAHGKTFETAGTELLDNARAYAMKQAAEATFRDSNMFSDAIVAMRFRNPDTVAKKALNMIGEGILPFRKTPANILVRAVEYSPVGVITTMAETVYGKKTGTFNANKLIDSLAKNATGTMIFAVGALLSNLGLLKGKEPDEDKEKEFDALTGHQAYSIELPNGMSLTLDWLAPSSVPLFLGAQFAENAADAGLSFRDVLTAMGAITDPMLQMSMLQGLDDALANASTYGDDSALVRFTGNALWSFMTQGLTNTMLGQLERSLTNERSTTYRDKHKDVPDGIQYLIGKTLEKVPLPGADYGQIPYIDAWGRIETNARTDFGNVLNQFFVPSYVSWVEESKMEKELRRLYESNPDENASVLISRPKSYFNVDSKRKDLTAEEFIEYATTRGQTAYNVATDLTESKIYRTLSDKQKAEAVLKAYDFANQMAKAVTTGYTPDKWGEEAPEGAVNPDKWVKDAMTCATEYGIPVGEYAAIYAATKDLESYKDAKGETVDNSKSLKVAVAIYDMGLSDVETKSLLEAFGVNQTVRKYSDKTARAKLKAMKDKYE